MVRIQSLKKLLLIPNYSDEVQRLVLCCISFDFLKLELQFQVASVNSEIVDTVMSMSKLTHFYLGLTTEWLESMSSLLAMGNTSPSAQKDSFPINVNGTVDMYSLGKLSRTLATALPTSKVKILKMKRNSVGKQFLDSLIRN